MYNPLSDAVNNTLGRIKKIFKNAQIDAIFLMNTDQHDSNFFYLTGFTSGVFEFNTLIVKRKKLILPVSSLEYEIALEQKPKAMSVVKIDSRKDMIKLLKKYLKSKRVGINASFLPYNYYKAIKKEAMPKKFVDISKAFSNARSVKDEDEIKNIRIANKISKKALLNLQRELKAGMTEKETAGKLNYFMMKEGASGIAFDTIVSFNENAALPHHSPDNTKLKSNSIVLIDFGAKYNNYCADVTRTFMFKPDKSSTRYKRFVKMYETVKIAQLTAFKKIKEGSYGDEVHAIAANYIDKAENGIYKGKFIHSLGHSIGLDVHDPGPGLGSKEKLKANMVVSDEPGIYIVGFGGVRIEDDVIVKKNGATMI
jgi:Xaa-Pro dipeptidase